MSVSGSATMRRTQSSFGRDLEGGTINTRTLPRINNTGTEVCRDDETLVNLGGVMAFNSFIDLV